jgi:hypothetical protein
MPAKALVPVEALPCIDRFRGHGPLLQKPPLRSLQLDAPRTVGAGHARESDHSGRGASSRERRYFSR